MALSINIIRIIIINIIIEAEMLIRINYAIKCWWSVSQLIDRNALHVLAQNLTRYILARPVLVYMCQWLGLTFILIIPCFCLLILRIFWAIYKKHKQAHEREDQSHRLSRVGLPSTFPLFSSENQSIRNSRLSVCRIFETGLDLHR